MLFPAWETFYVIVGSSAGALAGLMFVVMAFISDFKSSERQIKAFATPTVVHFTNVLLVAGILSAPWPAVFGIRLALAALGIANLVYMFVVVRRTRAQSGYQPEAEDWLFHGALPAAAYAAVFIAGVGVARQPTLCLFAVGVSALLLLRVGIHNAWDSVTYITISRWEGRRGDGTPPPQTDLPAAD